MAEADAAPGGAEDPNIEIMQDLIPTLLCLSK